MKKLVSLLLILITIISCSRSVVEPAINESTYYSLNRETINEYDRIELAKQSKNIQIWTLNEYTPERKVDLFKDKMQTILDQGILTSIKASVISYVNSHINEQHFTDNTTYNNFIKELQDLTGNAHFTDEEIISIFFTIDDVIYENAQMRPYHYLSFDSGFDEGGGDTKPDCNMSWCLTCGLTGGEYNCESGCNGILRGCGWFLQQPCEKICK